MKMEGRVKNLSYTTSGLLIRRMYAEVRENRAKWLGVNLQLKSTNNEVDNTSSATIPNGRQTKLDINYIRTCLREIIPGYLTINRKGWKADLHKISSQLVLPGFCIDSVLLLSNFLTLFSGKPVKPLPVLLIKAS